MKTILIVEDEIDIAAALDLVFSGDGYGVVTAANGKEGLARLAESRPDLVLLDVMMPVVDGREMLRIMRQSPTYRRIPVIVMTAGSTGPASELRAEAVVKKPFNLCSLTEMVERVAGRPDAA